MGSVKTNIGHLDTAAGVVSLIKATLALENRKIPPSLNFEAPNPRIAFEGSPFKVAAKLSDWQRGSAPRRAAINSLGVGGTNAFVIVEEAPPVREPTRDTSPQPIMFSARSRKALDEQGRRLAAWIRQNPDASLADVAYSLRMGRHEFDQRRVLGCSTLAEAATLLENPEPRRVFTHTRELDKPSLVFMFPGGGAQYVRMGRGLYEAEPVFRQHIDHGLSVLKSRFGADLAAVLFAAGEVGPEQDELLSKPSAQLPLTFLVEYALTKLWEHHGVRPAAAIGHSMGENTAACIAGVFSFEDALGLLLIRGQLVELTPPGGMLSVPMSAADLRPYLADGLDLASANSPQLSVASGPVDLLKGLAERLAATGVDTQVVRVSVAGHSRLLDEILPRFRAYLKSIQLNAPKFPVISNRTGKWLEASQARDPEYWVSHLRNSILFSDGVQTLLEADDRVFLEVGPGNMLGSFVRQHPGSPTQRVISSMRHVNDPVSDHVYFRGVLARLWAVGVGIDIEKLWPGVRNRVPLPTYAFQHARYWVEPTLGADLSAQDVTMPERIGRREDWFFEPKWIQQGVLEQDDEPHVWLVFHSGEPVAAGVIADLQQRGQRVIQVAAGDAFAQIDDDRYTLAAEAGGAGYQDLIDSLTAREIHPDRVLHTWLLTWDTAFRPGSSFFHRNQEYGFYSLLYLARALTKGSGAERVIHMIVAANGSQRVGSEALPFPEKATSLGPVEVIPREFPNISCEFVDVPAPAAGAARKHRAPVDSQAIAPLTANLIEEVRARPANQIIAWRDGVRWQRHVRRSSRRSAGDAPRIRREGVYLITGGLGGIGGVIAEWLAREFKARLVLVGRTPLPQRADWDDWLSRHAPGDSISQSILKVRRLESLGAKVMPVAADVTVADRMNEVVTEAVGAFGDVHGVFHAAGVIRDSLIPLKSQRDIEDVFSAKLYGTVMLDEIFRHRRLDFMVLFSSTSAYVAPQGQVDYVGASSFVNAFARHCEGGRQYPVVALNWGIWRDVGMVGSVGAPAADAATGAGEPASAAPSVPLGVRSPLFARRLSSREGLEQRHVLEGRFSADDSWMINEHRLKSGEALLSGTGYIELIRASLAEAEVTAPWEITNLVFESPLYVEDHGTRDFRVVLAGGDGRWEVAVMAAVAVPDGTARFERCATARVRPCAAASPPTLSIDAIDARCADRESAAVHGPSLTTRQESHLNFGPRWRVLRRLGLGEREALARLQLPDVYAADVSEFALHPAMLDIATGCAMDLIPGYADREVAQNLWAPISYRAFRFFGPMPAEIFSWIRLAGESSVASDFAAFDVTLTDVSGNVLAEVDQLTLRRLEGRFQVAKPVAIAEASDTAAGAGESSRGRAMSPGEIALQHNVAQGIAPVDGIAVLATLLNGPLPAEIIISSMDVQDLLRQAESITRASSTGSDTRFSRPELDTQFEAPRDDIEIGLAELWGKLLGVEGVGIRDSFFDLGGHSLIAVRLFNDIAEKFKVDLPMSVLAQSPSIEPLATLIRGGEFTGTTQAASTAKAADSASKPLALRYRHIVPMNAGPVAARTPLFVVAGMFGNVLNLSHLAHLLGEERPFYALQARGLFGDESPHETFEDMATDYIHELRQVQAHGPYLLGGFSGGGLIAFEMARQLMAAGEKVLSVLMLDTPVREIPQFSLADKLSMLSQGLSRGGMTFLRNKIRERIAYEKAKRERRNGDAPAATGPATSFQSQRIGEAFMRALVRYKVPKVNVHVAVFRPKLDIRFRLSGGRLVDAERNYISPDNGWTNYVAKLEVFEVPGNHDSMVLEPNVRVMVSLLRRVIDGVEGRAG